MGVPEMVRRKSGVCVLKQLICISKRDPNQFLLMIVVMRKEYLCYLSNLTIKTRI